jgi:hypothetical protein
MFDEATRILTLFIIATGVVLLLISDASFKN